MNRNCSMNARIGYNVIIDEYMLYRSPILLQRSKIQTQTIQNSISEITDFISEET